MKTKPKKKSKIHIDAGTGRFVSAKYAAAHPKTTVSIRIKRKPCFD